ncbi:sensor histidine kinase [Flavobacterium tyrosinilyticum]|uniref:sensor histidine kinase n=1 Tax=Flavobacterium tyrosinilyticum TaxID=1658740 RepID=UPI00202FB33F|nr:ATP-binding protein [Flavobacterium tyrosinilyticum]MCM0666873.1 ATP-binding protein [Flavobacterium tyrosinilyticum]
MPKIAVHILRYCCFLLLLITTKMACQENYSARWYTADNNELQQNSIKAIVQGKHNFIWMTTENGIVRYDGNNFLVFNSSNTSLEHTRFTDIFGSIEKDSLTSFNESKKELVFIRNGKVQILKKSASNSSLVRNGRRFFFHDGLPSNYSINERESYYIRLSNGNIFFIDNQKVELCDSKMKSISKTAFQNDNVFNFFAIDNSLFYLADNGDYYCFSKKGKSSGKLNALVSKNNRKLYWNITTGQVFLSIKNKIYQLKNQNDHLTAQLIVEYRDFETSNIIAIYFDQKNKKLYLGSGTNGLCIISFPVFKTVTKNKGKAEVYYAAQAFSDSTVITSEGLIISNKGVLNSIPFPKSVYLDERINIALDDEKNIWISRGMKILCYLKKSAYKEYRTYPFDQNPKTIFKDNSNTIWVALSLDEFHKPKLYSIKNGVSKLEAVLKNNINYIVQQNNILYLAGDNGLFLYNLKTKKLDFAKNTEKINIRSVFIDSKQKIWLTTYEKGFFLYENQMLHSFPTDEEHYLNTTHCIIEDKNNFFWISTNKGLFQVSRKALLQYIKNKNTVIYYHQYTKSDGFLINEFNGGCQHCGNFLKNNDIVFPSMNGIVFFNPYKVAPLLPGKELFIDRIVLDQKTIDPKDTIVLNNNFQRVSFLVSYPYYGNPKNLAIEAKMDKIGSDHWERLKADKSISFTTLPPGTYKLTFRSLSGFNANYAYKTVILVVPAKFYQTIWFAILCGILAVGFVISIWHIRLYYQRMKRRQLEEVIAKKTKKLASTVKKLEKTENNLKQEIKQHEMLVKSVSHDIKSPLKFLSSSIKHISENSSIQDDQRLKQQLTTLQTSTSQLYEYVENLIKYSSIFIEGKKLEDESYSLHELIEERIQIFEKIAEAENVSIANNVEKGFCVRTNKKALSIIIHNLIDNAIKNTKNGRIELLCTIQENILTLKIIDNGKGMSKELIDYYHNFYKNPISKNYHLGLHMIIELLILIEGNINIISDLDKGTTIEIMVEYN